MEATQMHERQAEQFAGGSKPQWRWYHGVIFYVAIQTVSFGLSKLTERWVGKNKTKVTEPLTGNPDSFDFYNSLKQPRFAPPDWGFAPVWIVNNVLCIWGLLHVANLPKERRGRAGFLWFQALTWACFTTFSSLYFGLRSPISGAVNTVLGLLFTIASVVVATTRLRDGKAILSQITMLPWLVVASATSGLVALWNKDQLFGNDVLVQPDEKWVKATQQDEQQ
jgi:benzodiazapine receptor